MKHLTQVEGRYIVMPENLYYYIDSGRWKGIWGPLSAFYWIIVVLFTLGIWIYRAMARRRAEIYS